MMTSTRQHPTGLSMEAVPSGQSMPDWLVEALLCGRRFMIIHPSEESRKQAIDILHTKGNGKAIDTTHHLTIKRLVGILHLDLRLPVLMDDDGVLFEKTHRALAKAARNHYFPLLQANPQNRWSRSRSRRLLSLHSELIKLKKPWGWEGDPGAKSCDKVLKKLEKEMQATHPSRLNRTVWSELKECKEAPFTISDVEGIIMLDHPPGLDEVVIAILQELSRFTGLHQLVNPGSHRLGYHGEYLEDIAPIRNGDGLPEWLPNHEVLAADFSPKWQSIIGRGRNSRISHLMCELQDHSVLATANILSHLQGQVLIVSGNADSVKESIKPHLEMMGHRLATPSVKLNESSAVARIISIANLSQGEEAWSLSRLNDVWSQIELPMSWPMLELQHPTEEGWQPRLHAGILSEIARGFHLLGGRGALRRWQTVLSQATPRAGVDPIRRMKELEECQWWVACIANWMSPILSKNDQESLSQPVIGCSSKQTLPLPQKPSDVISWINSCIEQIDWETVASRDELVTNTIPGLQYLMAALSKLRDENIEIESSELSEILENISAETEIPSIRAGDKEIKILTPSQAHGLEIENLILCNLDAENWSMKPAQVPWLDESSRMKIGLHRPDEPLRQGRHILRHLLNSAKNIVIIDSSLEEGVELAGPLDEWFSDLNREGEISEMHEEPKFMEKSLWSPETSNRSWEWRTIDGENTLVYRVSAMEMSNNQVRTHRSGSLNRDTIQRAGLSSIESRTPSQPPLNVDSLLAAAEIEILSDQFSRRRIGNHLDEGEIFDFSEASNLVQSIDLKLMPTKTKPASGRNSMIWPHLGVMGKKGLSVPIDPRPINPPSTRIDSLDSITGRGEMQLKMPSIWSQGRLQSWLECPRKAWYQRHMYLGKNDELKEDLAATARGDIIHQIEESILRAHGLQEGSIPSSPTPLIDGPLDLEAAWKVALQTLQEKAPWMRREDGISAHRCRDLIGVSPSKWKGWIEEGIPITIGGRIGRMLESDFDLSDVAPIASEWELSSDGKKYVKLGLPENESSFALRGRIDKVDQLLITNDSLSSDQNEIIPLDFNIQNPPKSKRLVIIRDIKSIDGAKDNGDDERHLKGIFQELQLALYARAWEIANPGDRVIGVGATQVGIETQPYLEIDPEFLDHCELLNIGLVGGHTHGHYRIPGNTRDNESNPFRAWMRERITTAIRVIENASAGNIHPEPSNACKYCPIIDACPSAKRGGW
ncbi:MAG: PD-(D/E)XK nuclease family protein [Candidatus Poseidoniales archaeon]|nr:MAG: PD-(D/E)XK nuclease family protein [Candidatus Poseidoniales archaeon]